MLLPPVIGFVVDLLSDGGVGHRLYISGDTLLSRTAAEVGRLFPEIDTLVVHLGGTKLLKTLMVTMDGRQGAEFVRAVNPTQAIPVHHSDYTVFTSTLEDFLAETDLLGLRTRVTVVPPGATVALPSR